jgi:hypothetical protein
VVQGCGRARDGACLARTFEGLRDPKPCRRVRVIIYLCLSIDSYTYLSPSIRPPSLSPTKPLDATPEPHPFNTTFNYTLSHSPPRTPTPVPTYPSAFPSPSGPDPPLIAASLASTTRTRELLLNRYEIDSGDKWTRSPAQGYASLDFKTSMWLKHENSVLNADFKFFLLGGGRRCPGGKACRLLSSPALVPHHQFPESMKGSLHDERGLRFQKYVGPVAPGKWGARGRWCAIYLKSRTHE